MTGSTSMLEENRIWPWRGNRWEIWARNLGNLFRWSLGAKLGKDLDCGARWIERDMQCLEGSAWKAESIIDVEKKCDAL